MTDVINILKGYFGEITVTRGKKHYFLGMNITFRDDGTVEIEMKHQILEALDMIDESIGTNVTTPANKRLYEISQNAVLIDKKNS